jgi:hypothetical protein
MFLLQLQWLLLTFVLGLAGKPLKIVTNKRVGKMDTVINCDSCGKELDVYSDSYWIDIDDCMYCGEACLLASETTEINYSIEKLIMV